MNSFESSRSIGLADPVPGKTPRPSSGVFVGVDLGLTVVRAGVFSSTFELLGKTKLSTKKERGVEAVLGRAERCVRYAVDECDLTMDSVQAIGVGVPGIVLDGSGTVAFEERFGWNVPIPIISGLRARLKCPVSIGNEFTLAARAVQMFECGGGRNDVGVLFPGVTLGVGLVLGGKSRDPSSYPSAHPLLPPGAGGVIRRFSDPQFEAFRARDFRKAVRKGNAQAAVFLRKSIGVAAEFGARLVRECCLGRLVLAGGAIDENKAEMLSEFREVLDQLLGAEIADEVEIRVSELGDLPVLMGAAFEARENAGATKE